MIFKRDVQEDEINRTSDLAKREALLDAYTKLGTKVPTGAAISNVSKFGESKFGAGAGDVTADDVTTPARNHSEDALLAATAATEADVFVTEDDRLKRRIEAKNPRVQVWSYEGLVNWVETVH